jgi:hypothetical protein
MFNVSFIKTYEIIPRVIGSKPGCVGILILSVDPFRSVWR